MPDPLANSPADREPSPVLVVTLLCLIAAIAYIGRSCLGVASEPIQSALELSQQSLGIAMSAFFWSYALAQIPTGLLGQHWGPRRALVIFAMLGAVCCALMASAVGFWSLVAVQILFGISQAGLFPSAAQAIKQWIPAENRAFSSGSLGAAMSIGAFLGTMLTGLLFQWRFDWRQIYLIYAPLGLIWSAVLLAVLRPPSPRAAVAQPVSSERIRMAPLLFHWDMWMICGQQFFRAAGYSMFLTWFPQYLQNTRGISVASSGYLTSVPLLGVVFGSLLGGLAVDAIHRVTGSRRASRQGAAMVSTFGTALFILAATRVTHPFGAVVLIACGAFLGGLSGACAYTVTIDKAGRHVAPIFGVMNMTGNFGAAAFPAVVPLFLKAVNHNWDALLYFLATIYMASGVFWWGLNPEGELLSEADDRALLRDAPDTMTMDSEHAS